MMILFKKLINNNLLLSKIKLLLNLIFLQGNWSQKNDSSTQFLDFKG